MEEFTATYQNYQSNTTANIIMLILGIIAVIGAWRVFVKAGVPGWHSIRTIRETHDYEKDRIRLLNKLEEYELQDIIAERLGILPQTKNSYTTSISSSSIIKSSGTLQDCFAICLMNSSSNCKS